MKESSQLNGVSMLFAFGIRRTMNILIKYYSIATAKWVQKCTHFQSAKCNCFMTMKYHDIFVATHPQTLSTELRLLKEFALFVCIFKLTQKKFPLIFIKRQK